MKVPNSIKIEIEQPLPEIEKRYKAFNVRFLNKNIKLKILKMKMKMYWI